MPGGTSLTERVVHLLLVVASVVLCFVAAELLGRFWLSDWPFEEPMRSLAYLTEKDKTLRWRYPPSDSRNSLGLRNEEVREKLPGTLRVVVLGDSMVWSGETSSGRLYTEVVEHELSRRLPVEVINAGVPGYTTYQALEFLRIYGLDMRPDIVLHGITFNDVYHPYLHRPTNDSLLGWEPDARLNRFDPEPFLNQLVAWSQIAHWLVAQGERHLARLTGARRFGFERRGDFYLAWKDYGWRDTEHLLSEMAKMLDARGIALAFMVFPVSEQFVHSDPAVDREYLLFPQREVARICREIGVPCLDLTDAIGQAGGETLYRDYLHLAPEGNDIVARRLPRFLRQSFPEKFTP